jgi:phenylacetate-CoA ligase
MLPKIIAYQRRREMKSMAARGTLLLANSPVLAAEMETLYHQKAQFIPTNSIRRSEFSPFQIRPLSAPWKLLYCGRLDLKKGLQELFQALAILNAGGHACQLDMVGAIDSEVYPYLSSLAKRLEIDRMVRWHGLIPYGDQLFQFYRRADALILPSYTEGFPHAIWEAAGNCCPIVTTDAGGIPALLEHDSHALLIRTHDIDAIAGALLRLFSDELLRRRIITNAYNHALQFSAEACAIKLVSVLEAEWN